MFWEEFFFWEAEAWGRCLIYVWYIFIFFHGENDGTLGMVPLIINPIYTLYSGYLLGFMGYIPF